MLHVQKLSEALRYLCSCLSSNLSWWSLFLYIFSLSSTFRTLTMWVDQLDGVPQVLSVQISSIFHFLFFKVDHFLCSIFMFTDSFVCLNLTLNISSKFIFCFYYCTVQLQNFYLVSFYILFFFMDVSILFIHGILDFLRVFLQFFEHL